MSSFINFNIGIAVIITENNEEGPKDTRLFFL